MPQPLSDVVRKLAGCKQWEIFTDSELASIERAIQQQNMDDTKTRVAIKTSRVGEETIATCTITYTRVFGEG